VARNGREYWWKRKTVRSEERMEEKFVRKRKEE